MFTNNLNFNHQVENFFYEKGKLICDDLFTLLFLYVAARSFIKGYANSMPTVRMECDRATMNPALIIRIGSQ